MSQMPKANIDRRKLLPQLFLNAETWLLISGLAGASRDAAALTDDGPNLFSMAGTMGAAVPMGLGVALSAPEQKIAVINGDGEMLMGIGSLATVASARPANLTVVCLDNSMHGETVTYAKLQRKVKFTPARYLNLTHSTFQSALTFSYFTVVVKFSAPQNFTEVSWAGSL